VVCSGVFAVGVSRKCTVLCEGSGGELCGMLLCALRSRCSVSSAGLLAVVRDNEEQRRAHTMYDVLVGSVVAVTLAGSAVEMRGG